MDLGVVGVILAVIFGITTTVLAVRLARRKKLVWAHDIKEVVSIGRDAPLELQLTFSGVPISDIYKSKFILFNRGNEAVRKNDVTESVTIFLEGAQILRPPVIIATSKQAINIQTIQIHKHDGDAIEIDFLYLDHNDGVLFEVLHTRSKDIICEGNVIGVTNIRDIGRFTSEYSRSFFYMVPAIIVVSIISLAIIIISNISPFGWNIHMTVELGAFFIFGMTFGALLNIVPRFIRLLKVPSWSRYKK